MAVLSTLAGVLFIGHSLVGGTLPGLVEAALRHQGVETTVEAQVINGAPLIWNWDHSAEAEGVDGRARLATGAVGVLVVTEGLPLATNLASNDTPAQIARFAAVGLAANPALQVYVMETWHSLRSGTPDAPQDDPGAVVAWRDRIAADLTVWESIADDATAAMPGGAAPVRVIPSGQAMGHLADALAAGTVPGFTDIAEFFHDDIHPNDRGWQFLALVHAAAISGRGVEGLPARLTRHWPNRAAILPDAAAGELQRIATQVVAEYRTREDARLARTREDARLAGVVAVPPPPPPETAPLPPVLAGVTNPSLALGLGGINDWTVQQPFIDRMKTARFWIGHLPGQWDGWHHDDLAAKGWLDANGWPRAVPPELSGISALVLTDLPEDAGGLAGTYRLTWRGTGEVAVGGRGTNQRRAPGEIWFDFIPGPGFVTLTIVTSDPADPIRDMVVVREDQIAAHASGAIFNPDWLARIRGVQLVRFMDWMSTNNSTVAQWQDRPKLADYTWARQGVPLEAMLALANELQADPWFTLPHLADDAYVRAFAQQVHAGLDPGLRAHVELSNEVWNWQFTQAAWAEERGRARWNREATWVEYYALRAAEVMDIWAQVFAGQSERLVRIVGVQTGWIGLEQQILAAAGPLSEGRNPATSFDAYAVTGYFSAALGSDEKAPMVRGWIAESLAAAGVAATEKGLTGAARDAWIAAHRFDRAVTLAAAELRDGSVSGDDNDTMLRMITEVLPYHAGVARSFGLDLMMYEGGTHVVGFGPLVDDEMLTEFFIHLNYTPEMAALYAEAMAGWRRLTDAPFNAFVDLGPPSKWGSWGAMRHLTDDNPRWQVLSRGCAGC